MVAGTVQIRSIDAKSAEGPPFNRQRMPELQLKLDDYEGETAPDLREATAPAVVRGPRFARLRAVRLPFTPERVPAERQTDPAADIPEASITVGSRRRDEVYRRLLGASDVMAAAIAGAIAFPVLGDDVLRPLAPLALPLAVVVGKVAGLYDRDEHLLRKTTLDEAPALFRVATLYTLVLFLAGDLIVAEGTFGRGQIFALWIILFVCMLAARSGARRLARAVAPEERCLVLGDAEAGAWLSSKMKGAHGLNARIVGRVPLEPDPPGANGLPLLGDYDRLGIILAERDIDRVIIAPGHSLADHILDAVRRVKALGVKVSVLPRLFEVVGSSVEFDDIDGAVLLGVRRYGLSHSSKMLKRGVDVTLATIGLIVIAPLLAAIAVAIKLGSPGPVFFRQSRMGRDNVPFEMLKFRTMVDGAEAQKAGLAARNEAGGGLFKIQRDPRITRVGSFLRRTSLDELPQLWNVLRGDMALVGPRPLVIDEDARIMGWRRRRLLLTPGMTGLWQIFGSARIPMNEMVKIDYLYGANWSPWLDVKILLRTVSFVLARRGL
jgi:exopolysaccharide biosynthesis polyprenyl glycosylphosphotransferase